ncbi:uncharacterized protein K441DRAFT_725802 [Cenococcum geophilum 1.58]|uniref:uncharacterized protein n=1 Tax=Cenococcum geophilum 1.58 TaxID=794803 RepID=UPI00358FCCF3|nr:hypothetical protein K441DRAFT_725802 [Cenococcum geophilum 1.58]
MSAPNNIVLFHYSYSPYVRRVIWYLALRAGPNCSKIQPLVLPRDDLTPIGVNYRRVSVVSIGRDIYCDTRLTLQKLEERVPNGTLGAGKEDEKAIKRLLEKWTVEGPLFLRAALLIPTNPPAMADPKFTKDREDLCGRQWSKDALERGRPESIAYMRSCFDLLGTTLLADGRDWILKTDKPPLADIEAIWPFDWLVELKGSMQALSPKNNSPRYMHGFSVSG